LDQCNIQVSSNQLSFNPIPADVRIILPCFNNMWDIRPEYDGLSTFVTTTDPMSRASTDKIYGAVKRTDGVELVPEGWKLVAFDNDGQPIGFTTITDTGSYGMVLFGDLSSTPQKDGIPIGSQVCVVFAQEPDGLFYHASFDQPVTMDGAGTVLERDVTVGDLALATITWTGSADTKWGAGQAANWSLNGAPRVWWDGDHAIVDDTAGPQTLTLVGTVYPGSVLVNNAISNIVLGGTGSIAGPCGLTKNGAGTLMLATSNAYTGDTRISAGTLVVAADGALGASTVRLGDTTGSASASLLISGALTVDRPITVEDDESPTSLRTLGGTNTAGVAVFSGDITLAKDLTLTAASGGTVRFDGALDDAEGHMIAKIGEGTVIFDGLQNYGPGAVLNVLDGTVILNTDAGSNALATLMLNVMGAEVDFGCDQHLDTLSIGDGGTVRFTGAHIVVLNHLVFEGMDLGATTLTPEPATLGLLALGGLGALLLRRK
jgi:autotransporter-associated beta strand protein